LRRRNQGLGFSVIVNERDGIFWEESRNGDFSKGRLCAHCG
jgi:hypothetical protein